MERYSRQALFEGIGEAGQRRLLAARVAVVGCGATGSVMAELLARAGIGWLRLVDRDFVEWSNLQRQALYDEEDAREALPKAVAAERRLRRINSEIALEGVVADLNPASAEALLGGVELVLDGTDNLETRYLINDACVRDGRAWIYTGAVAGYGIVMPIRPPTTACLRCLIPHPPAPGTQATCDTAGVLGPAVAAVGALAVTETIQLLLESPESAAGSAIHVDVWHAGLETTPVLRRTDCPCCVGRQFPFLRGQGGSRAAQLCGRNAVQILPGREEAPDLAAVAERLSPLGDVRLTPHLLKARVEGYEITLFPDGRAIVGGTEDEGTARSVYARYVGV